MTITNQQKLKSIFPDMPREVNAIDENKNFHHLWSLYFDVLTKALQTNLKPEGFLLPSLTSTQIATIQAIYTPLIGWPLPLGIQDISGQMVFDSTNRVPKIFIITYSGLNVATATWKTFTLV